MSQSYLDWVIRNTRTSWWHDSADPGELDRGLGLGAVGATTNPFLSSIALAANRELWAREIQSAIAESSNPEQRAENLMRIPVVHAARKLLPQFQASGGQRGYVCAQVNPARAGDRAAMLEMARRLRQWSPNITVKLPATAAGLDVLEDCAAEGISTTATVSFTVPQVLAVAERNRLGIQRANAKRIAPAKCFAVIMIGRLDDYLREVAADAHAEIAEADIRQAGLAATKRAYALFRQRGYEASMIIAALRGTHHMTELAGAEMIMSIFPAWQTPLSSTELPREERIDRPIAPEVIGRLSRLKEFVRAYEPDGMQPEEFITYGVTQRTLGQFYDAGWKLMETFKI
jgi:transaldolase